MKTQESVQTTYQNLDSMLDAWSQLDTFDTPEAANLKNLFRVYLDAWKKPPAGVIGVGAITHAENVLIDYQMKEAN